MYTAQCVYVIGMFFLGQNNMSPARFVLFGLGHSIHSCVFVSFITRRDDFDDKATPDEGSNELCIIMSPRFSSSSSSIVSAASFPVVVVLLLLVGVGVICASLSFRGHKVSRELRRRKRNNVNVNDGLFL
jgi:hypothetical protein